MRLLASYSRQHFREIAAPKSFCTLIFILALHDDFLDNFYIYLNYSDIFV